MIPFISSNLIRIANISSKLCHASPPLLRAFDLSNQHISLFQKNKVSIFSDHCSIIHTKSPSFPPLSFLPKNPSFSHFPSIASFVAQFPSDEWRHHQPSLLNDVHTHNPTTKAPTHLSTSKDISSFVSTSVIPFPCESSLSSSFDVTGEANIQLTMLATSLMRMWREWEEKVQVYPMPHASAISFRCESSLNSSESSLNSSVDAIGEANIELTMLATSLMRMRREWEEKVQVYPMPHTSVAAAPPTGVGEEHPDWSNECDKSELSTKEITGNVLATALLPLSKPSPTPSSTMDTGGKTFLVRGRQEMEDLILKLEDETPTRGCSACKAPSSFPIPLPGSYSGNTR